MIELCAVANSDDVTLAWRTAHSGPDEKLAGCVGFAIQRRVDGGAAEYLETFMPFDDDTTAQPGDHHPSWVWPIQRYLWTDHLAPSGELEYRIAPVSGGKDTAGKFATVEPAAQDWSAWSKPLECKSGSTPSFETFSNRGIVSAPWATRELDKLAALPANAGKSVTDVLTDAISTPGNQLREDLAGTVLGVLRDQFADAAANGLEMFVCLYELRDQELTDLLIAHKDRVHVILGNGAFRPLSDPKPDPDPNHDWAVMLTNGGVDVSRRMVGSGHYAHNKFIVFVDGTKPLRVWTGSTNWTPSGLCTQSNHAVIIDDEGLATGFKAYWDRLRDAGDAYPKTLVDTNSTPVDTTVAPDSIAVRAWFVAVRNYVDLDDARARINAAQQGALFLMFRPGDTKTLVDDLKKLHNRGLFLRGVCNTGFLGKYSGPTIQFFNKSSVARHVNPELVLPSALRDQVANDEPEVTAGLVLIHSKTIVLDPFGAHPVIMTGSHNLGTKASAKNDDNLVIIDNAPGLAAEFAVYIMNVYDQYRWRYEKGLRAKADKASAAGTAAPANVWHGLKTRDTWQNASYRAGSAVEARFWFGD